MESGVREFLKEEGEAVGCETFSFCVSAYAGKIEWSKKIQRLSLDFFFFLPFYSSRRIV